MRQRHIETFFAVMTYGTVTKAALRLGVSQPSVTTTLRQAEKEIGFLLFQRRNGRLLPTAEARLLYEEVGRAQASLAAVETLCKQLRKGGTSRLRVASIQTFTETLIPAAVQKYIGDHKNSAIEVETQSSNRILEALEMRLDQYDLGLIFGSAGEHSVYSVSIGKVPILCVMPVGWRVPLSGGKVKLKSLKGYPMIGLSEQEPVGRAARALLFEEGLNPDIRVVAQNHSLAGDLAGKGLGFTLLDDIAAERTRKLAGNVRVVPVHGAPEIAVTAVLARAENFTSAPRRFMELCAEMLP